MGRGALLIFALAWLGGCACGGPPREVRWPASPDGMSLARELWVSARGDGRATPLSVRGRPVDVDEALPADAPGIHARSFVYDGIWVAEIVLGEVAPDAELPLVVIFHGRGDRPRIPGGPFGRAPTPMRVLVPRGPLALGRGFAWARHSVSQPGHEAELASDIVAITERLLPMIEHVRRTRHAVGTPIVTGFSQGAIVAWTMALRHPDRIGLVIPMAGWVLPAARPAELIAPPTRALHGTADAIVRVEWARELVLELAAAGNDVMFVELDGVEHVVTPEMNTRFEEWLEEALRERAPALAGGLGEPGADPEPVEPSEEPADVDESEEAVPAPLPDELDEVDEALLDAGPEEDAGTEEDAGHHAAAAESQATDDPPAAGSEQRRE